MSIKYADWLPTDDENMILVHNPNMKEWNNAGWIWNGLEYSMIGNKAYWTFIRKAKDGID